MVVICIVDILTMLNVAYLIIFHAYLIKTGQTTYIFNKEKWARIAEEEKVLLLLVNIGNPFGK